MKYAILLSILAMAILMSPGMPREDAGEPWEERGEVSLVRPEVEGESLARKISTQLDENTNYVFSPLSLKAALAMTANGAMGESQQELVEAMGFKDIEDLNAHMKALTGRYSGKGEAVISSSNSVWVNELYPDFASEFTSALEDCYNADAERTSIKDFTHKTNAWIKEKSQGLQDLKLQAGANFAMALINTTYFKGQWATAFDPDRNYDGVFHNATGGEGNVTYMTNTFDVPVYRDEDITLVKLPYKDGERNLSFYAAMGDTGVNMEEYISLVGSREVVLSLPVFKGHSTIEMNDIVRGLGITKIFTPAEAELNGVFKEPVGDLYVDRIIQDTVIDVNEEGTEAASTTVIMIDNECAIMEEPMTITFDRPFTYLVMDEDAGEVLFMGRYANSTQE